MNQEDNDNPDDSSRRKFLQLGVGTVLGGAALNGCGQNAPLSANDSQRALKRQGASKVILEKTTYADLQPILEKNWLEHGLDINGKKVFLKINLVDWRENKPLCTDPRFVDAVLQTLERSGASEIRIGDGPAITRDSERLLNKSGIDAVLKKHALRFVDLNIDDLSEVSNPLRFTGEEKFLLPRSVVSSDIIISLPKLKTHHWALMTASMKNMFGVLPGRKYGWPKNILHVKGITQSILDLVGSVKPHYAIVDGIEAMEGDGPLNGTGLDFQTLVMGEDLVAVDTVCATCMKLPVNNIPYLRVGGQCLGNADLSTIELIGRKIVEVERNFELPPTFEADGKPRDMSSLKKGADAGFT